MEIIICKCSLWPKGGLPAECHFKPPEGQAVLPSCCCQHILYNQLDFVSQKPLLQEHIKSHGHLCNFYPRYHCELNFIEQYWGVAKLRFRIAGRARTLRDMETKMLQCLDDVPLKQIQRCSVFCFLFFIFGTKTVLQICKPVGTIYICLSSRLIWGPSSMGQ